VKDADYAALRRTLEKYSATQGEIECEHCGTQAKALYLVSPHRDEAFELIVDEGYDMGFDPQQEKAIFYEVTQAAIIKKMFELGDTATLCKGCGSRLLKIFRNL
jgi:DNA-directed RNA polymerase subunit RPC12/RpoP